MCSAAGGTISMGPAPPDSETPISYLITPVCFRAPPAARPMMPERPRSAP